MKTCNKWLNQRTDTSLKLLYFWITLWPEFFNLIIWVLFIVLFLFVNVPIVIMLSGNNNETTDRGDVAQEEQKE